MSFFTLKLTGLRSLLLLIVYILPQEAGSQASRSREGCFNSTPELGMARGTIPDSDITASSMINSHSEPYFARLGNSKAWSADRKDLNPWIQVNLQKAINITAIATQGFTGSYVRQYYLSYSVSGNQWTNYTTQGVTKVFQANANDTMVTTVVLNPLVVAQYIRLHPTNCSKYCTLRMELYGCNSTAGFPGRPPAPTVSYISTTSISIQWNAPDEVGDGITGYHVRWQEEGASIPKQNVTSSTAATLNKLTPYTWYTIQVQAYNNKGVGLWSEELRVRSNESVPSVAPGNFKLDSSSSLSLDVSWHAIPAKQQQGKLLGYRIEYIKNGSGVHHTKDVGPNQYSYKIEKLYFANYSVKVAGYTGAGVGKFTEPESRFPNEGVPSVAPGNFKLGSSSSLSLDVSWDAIPAKQQQGKLLGYKIEYKKNGSGVQHTKTVGPNEYSYKIEKLDFASYSVKVAGYTGVGVGNFTEPKSRFPNEGAPTPPRNLQLSIVSSTSISVTWEEPETKNGHIKRYAVSYGTASDILGKVVYTSDTTYLLSSLEENTEYFVQVLAETSVTGNPSEIKRLKTPEDAPSSDPVITKADTQAIDAHSIRVVWQEIIPKDQNGVITGYTVYYNFKDQGTTFSKNASEHDTRTLIKGLKPFTTYCFKVVGYTKVGRSPLTEPAHCVQTLQAGPSEPRNVQVQATSSTSIDVTWEKPAVLNGILQKYIVSYGTKEDYLDIHLEVTNQTFERKLSPLKKFTAYFIEVRGQTTELGNASRVLNATTFEDRPSAPTQFNGQVTSATSVFLSWSDPVSPNGIIRKYVITTFETVTGREVSREEVDALQELQKQKKISKLKPFTNYIFTVQAVTTEAGEMANFSAKTEQGVPGRPRDVRARLEDGSINVSWDEPADPNGIITGYEVYCKGTRSYNSSFETNIQVAKSFTSRFAVFSEAKLSPGTKYTIYVTASTIEGEGDKSDYFVVEKPSEAPPRPSPPRVVNDKVTPTTITISLMLSPDTNGMVIAHQVVIEKLGKVFKRSTASLADNIFGYEEAKENGDKFYIAANIDRGKITNQEDFVLGDGKKYGGYENVPLEPETNYKVYVRGITEVDGRWEYGEAAATTLPTTGDGPVVKGSSSDRSVALIAGILGALILIVIIAIAFLLYKRSNRHRNPNLDVENQKRKRREFDMKRSSGKRKVLAVPGEVINDADHPPIPVEQLSKHVTKLHKSDDRGYMIEYNKLDSGQEYAATAALLPENKAKNRYANIIAYDHSRVVLSTVDGIVGSDYINASRIDGYNKPNAYIATQGPVPPAFDDFWRMVWENQSSSIIMLTNLQERHKLKCHKYWPDETQDYGDISVMLVKSEHYSDYIIRTFNVKRESEKEEREVKQFHFTVWPDHGVPEYPTALLAFRRRVRAYNPADAGPMVVHCSAGVGRTGTFMVIDSTLDRIKAENTIDIFNYVAYLRTRRTAMVQTEEQYTFCHDAILEAVQCGNTQIYAHDLRIALARMDDVTKENKVSRFEAEFKTLNKVSPVLTKGSCIVASYPENKEKNRSPDVLAPDYYRVMLTAIDDNEATSYINAVHISGYKQQHAFIVTHHPLTPTVTDFWRMLCEQECSCVVLFDSTEEDGDFPLFWPEDESTYDDMITVQRLSASSSSVDNLKANYDQSQIVEKTFKATDLRTPEKSLRIKMFHYSGWIEEDKIPPCSGLITLIAKMEKWQQHSGNGPITVVCSDGIGRSGTFCALYSVLERLKIEQVVDVFQAIKAMRISRPGLVKSAAEYRFIHFAIQEYLSAFDDYANFKP